MEFKDHLKAVRKERNISQQELANAIYVSRSAVAKWENGLGIPNQTSYQALLDYFQVSPETLPLNEYTENVSVCKNQKIRILFSWLFCLIFIILSISTFTLIHALDNGYGFTSKTAAGEIWSDNPCIKTADYDFYYGTTGGDIQILDRFCVVKKKWIGYQKIDFNNRKDVYEENGNPFGYLYSFKGERKYYHIFRPLYKAMDGEVKVQLLSEIRIKEETFLLLYKSYFETEFPVTEFYVDNIKYIIKELCITIC